MTPAAPELAPEDLATCRAAWQRLRVECLQRPEDPDVLRLPVVQAVARHALACALAHREPAAARPLSVFPPQTTVAKLNHLEGAARTWTVRELAAWCSRQTRRAYAKGTSAFLAAGATRDGRHADRSCVAVGWVALDCDDGGTWAELLAVLERAGMAWVLYTSPSGRPTKWRVWLPLRTAWVPAAGPWKASHTRPWKKRLYVAARFALGALAALSGTGFDPGTSDLLNPFYPPAPATPAPGEPPAAMTVLAGDGIGLDLDALADALDALGVTVEPEQPRRARAAGVRQGRTWDPQDVAAATGEEPPLVTALRVAGWLGRQHEFSDEEGTASGWLALCPWRDQHSTNTDGGSATAVLPGGAFVCKHAHCHGRTARDVVAALPLAAREAFERATDTPRAVRRVLEALPEPPPRVAPGEAYDAARAGAVGAQDGEKVLVRVSPGAGKSHMAYALAAERQRQGLTTVLLVQNGAAVAEAAAGLSAAGAGYRVARGVRQVTDASGRPVCGYIAAVTELERMGVSPRAALCRGSDHGRELGPRCDRWDGCEAASPLGDWEGAPVAADAPPVVLTTHAMAPFALVTLGLDPRALVLVDESPGDLATVATLTPELLRAPDAFGDMAGRWRRAALDLVRLGLAHAIEQAAAAGAERDAVDLEDGMAAALQTPEGRTARRQWERFQADAPGFQGDPPEAPPELPRLMEALTQGGRPWPHTGALVSLRARGAAGPDAGARWRMAHALLALCQGEAAGAALGLDREGSTLRVTVRGAVAQALAAHAGPVVVLDGTGQCGQLAAGLGCLVREVTAVAQERGTVHRRVLAIPRATRTSWCPGGAPRWDARQASLAGALRALVERIRADVPRGARVALATFRPVAQALAAAWEGLVASAAGGERPTGPAADLLAPLLDHVGELRVTYYGARDTRGANVHADCDASVSLGDGYPNLGDLRAQAAAVGTDPGASGREHAAAALGQWHDRLRGVQRARELWSFHAGAVVPGGGQWDRESVTVQAPPRGRPVAGVDVRVEAAALVKLAGSERRAALAAGVQRDALRRALCERVSASVAARVCAGAATLNKRWYEKSRIQRRGAAASAVAFIVPQFANDSAGQGESGRTRRPTAAETARATAQAVGAEGIDLVDLVDLEL